MVDRAQSQIALQRSECRLDIRQLDIAGHCCPGDEF
jgi:hypothetical protein